MTVSCCRQRKNGITERPNLVDEAADGDHGKAGVLELGKLISPEGRLVSREVERVEAEVTRGTAINEHGALNT